MRHQTVVLWCIINKATMSATQGITLADTDEAVR